MTWEDIATAAAQGSGKAFGILWDHFGSKGALERTRIARAVLHQMDEDEAR